MGGRGIEMGSITSVWKPGDLLNRNYSYLLLVDVELQGIRIVARSK